MMRAGLRSCGGAHTLFLALLVVQGCRNAAPRETSAGSLPVDVASSPISRTAPDGYPTIAVEVISPPRARAGQQIALRLRLTNRASETTVVGLVGGRPAAYNFEIVRPDGSYVWDYRTSLGLNARTEVLNPTPFAPGASLEFSGTWNGKTADGASLPPGTYLIRGEVVANAPSPLTSPPVPIVLE